MHHEYERRLRDSDQIAYDSQLESSTTVDPRGRIAYQVLEDKANLVHLQRLMTAPTLESYIVAGRAEVDRWAKLRYRPDSPKTSRPPEQCSEAQVKHSADGELEGNWWCVKASGGNGGMDVWVMHEGNWMAVVERLHETEEYVIQV